MSRKEDCWDNAVTESFLKLSSTNGLIDSNLPIAKQLYHSIEKYGNWYNTKRIYFTLDYCSPLEMELKLTPA